MKRLPLVLLALALAGAAPPRSQPAPVQNPCGIPERQPLWIDFGDGSVPFWSQIFARPGLVVAASNLIVPPQLRAAGASTVYFDLYLNNRVGTPSAPADAGKIGERAGALLARAVASSGCDRPFIALNEFFGASLPTPLTPTTSRYRSNVLAFAQALAERGARPFLLLSSRPYVGGEAAAWWQALGQVTDFVPEVYFSAPSLWKQGPKLASRRLRNTFRARARDLLDLGIPPQRIGLMLGFQTTPGTGGREQLRPREAWFEVVKWQALAAKQVASELKLATVWSWGWGAWSAPARDPDKRAAACVYLWTRDPSLCDGPAAAGPRFDRSLTVGQLRLPAGIACEVGNVRLRDADVDAAARVTGDREVALAALFRRAVLAERAPLRTTEVLAAERAVVLQQFRGNRGAYLAALARARASVPLARGVLADELRRLRLSASFRIQAPGRLALAAAYRTYRDALVRDVAADRPTPWLGGRTRGYALAGFAPPQLFELDSETTVRSPAGAFRILPLDAPAPLSSLTPARAAPALRNALLELGRERAFHDWTGKRMDAALDRTDCRGDELPAAEAVDLTAWLPFLGLDGG